MAKRKKKNAITLISLLFALVVLIGIYVWYTNKDNSSSKGDKKDAVKTTTIAKIDVKKLNSIHLTNKKSDMTFVLDNNNWVLKNDTSRPINQDNVKIMLNSLGAIKADSIVTNKPGDLSEYGLSEPSIKIVAAQTDGKTLTLHIGNELSTGGGYYATANGNSKVFIISSSYYTDLGYSEAEMTKAGAPPTITANNITHIAVDNPGRNKDFELLFQQGNKLDLSARNMFSWVILKPYPEGYTADSTNVTNLLPNYASLSFSSLAEYNCKDLAKYGLKKPESSVYVAYNNIYSKKLDKPEKDPATGKQVKEKTITESKDFKLFIGSKAESGGYYVRMDGSNSVYTMTAEQVNKMLKVDTFNLLNKFVFLPYIDSVDSMDITISGVPYTMKITRQTAKDAKGKPTTKSTYYYNGKKVTEKRFKDVYQVVIASEYDAQIKQKVKTKGVDPFMTINYHLTDGRSVKTSYLPYDDSFYIVKYNDNVHFFADKRRIDTIADIVKKFKAPELNYQ